MAVTSKTKSIYFELISPDKQLISENVLQVVAVAETGEFGILANHANMVVKLDSAPLRYTDMDGIDNIVAVLGGVLEVKDNHITVITDYAVLGADIDEAEAQQAADKAKAALEIRDKPKTNEEEKHLLLMEHQLKVEILKLKAARLHRDL